MTILLFVTSATKVIGFSTAAEILESILGYVPRLFIAVTIVIIAVVVAKLIKQFIIAWIDVSGFDYSESIGNIFEAIFIIFAVIMAMDQLGINTSIITSNISIILAGIVFAISLSFGLGATTVVKNIISSYYIRQQYNIGDKVEIGKVKGEIVNVTNIAVIVGTRVGSVMILSSEFLSSKVVKK